jgi:outer membrane murein-binding lipoprotein Lpp
MTEAEAQVKRILERVQQLLKQRDALKKENEKYKAQLQLMKEEHAEAFTRLEQVQQKLDVLRLSKSEMGPEEKKALEKRLNQYIREIDRCLTFVKE